MKYLSKISLAALVISLSLLVSGCGSKEYTCTKSETKDNIETITNVKIKKDGIDTNIKVITTAQDEQQAEKVEKILNDSKLYSSVKRDGKKITAEYSKFFEGETSENDKKELESDGYTCK